MQDSFNVAFLINTYNRHDSLESLIRSIRKEHPKLHVYIIDDGSDPPITKYKFCPYTFVTRQENKGKKGYYETCNTLFDKVKDKHYDWYFMLPDDVTIDKGFVQRCKDKWQEIADTDMIALNLIADRQGLKCWTEFEPVDMGHSYLTNWIDMCFMCNKRFFKHLGKIHPITRRWDIFPMLGSGVGSYISRKLYAKGFKMYQVKESFVTFQQAHDKSRMNPFVETPKILGNE